MKFCPNCQQSMEDTAAFCTTCGTAFAAATQPEQSAQPQQPQPQPQQQQVPPAAYPPPAYAYAPAYDPHDHTADFAGADISENKVFAMLPYLLDIVGVLIALLGARSSAYAMFHVRQALKFTVVEMLLALACAVLVWTVIAPLAAGVLLVVLLVIKIICFFQVCSGKAKEAAIIRDLKFLK